VKIPIRVRLTLVYTAVFFTGMAALETAAFFGLKSSTNEVVDRELEARLAGLINFLTELIPRLPLPRLQAEIAIHAALHPDLLSIFDAAGGKIWESSALRGLTGEKPSLRSTTLHGIKLRVLTVRRQISGRDYDLNLGADLAKPEQILLRFRWILLLLAPVVLACASAAGYWISGRALAPVSGLTRAARTICVLNMGQRLNVPHSGDEIEELAVTLNEMLSRIEDSFRNVKRFTADASHELRTPLAVIRATAEVALLRSTGNANSYREALHRVLNEAERNSVLLDDLLRLARGDSDARPPKPALVDIAAILKESCERVQMMAIEKNIRVSVDAAPHTISGEANDLMRLCLILLDNALKYTLPGGSVSASVSRARGTIALQIRDTGIGISEHDLPNIFARFYRADEARTRDGGAGLGLAIARSIADAHHAEIQVTSALGQGTTFRVSFHAMSGERLATEGTLSV
jgi:two-component system heavy metal sensor histidine kinase CusS